MMTPSSGVEIGRQMASGEYREFLNTHSSSLPRLPQLPIFIEHGDVETIVKTYATDKGLDLIVLGSQGKSTITRMLVGSTAESMMLCAPSDVLVIPQERSAP